MDNIEFTNKALRTESRPETLNVSPVGLHALLALAVASTDIMDAMKKVIFYGKELDSDKLFHQALRLNDIATFVRQAAPVGGLVAGDNPGFENPELQLDAVNKRLLHAAIGMFTESGEMLEALKGALEGVEFDKVNFVEELGDSDWYKAIAHDEIGIPETAARAIVIAKLEKRYPEKYTDEAALNRDIGAEREVLEAGVGS